MHNWVTDMAIRERHRQAEIKLFVERFPAFWTQLKESVTAALQTYNAEFPAANHLDIRGDKTKPYLIELTRNGQTVATIDGNADRRTLNTSWETLAGSHETLGFTVEINADASFELKRKDESWSLEKGVQRIMQPMLFPHFASELPHN
jgi:hypothetical protein